jgi:SAM-dependent methyltransferase
MIDYNKIARYYDLIQQGLVDYGAEARIMHDIFRHHDVHTVLDMACGTGAHLLELAKLGYQCFGIDLSPEMIEVAREKAQAQKLSIEFRQGDMLTCYFDQTFDVVLNLYAPAPVSDENFRTGLANARRAVRDGGLFYINLLNAEFEGAEQARNAFPAFYLDVVVNESDVRLVRFNQVAFSGDLQNWTAIYLIDEGNGVYMVVGTEQLRLHHLEPVKEELTQAGFELRSVTYADIQGIKDCDMFILAQAKA